MLWVWHFVVLALILALFFLVFFFLVVFGLLLLVLRLWQEGRAAGGA